MTQWLIFGGVCLLTLTVVALVHFATGRQERRRRHRLERVDRFDPLATPDQIGASLDHQRRHAKRRVALRFTVIRRTLVAALLLVGAALAVTPFLNQVSAAALSVFAGALSVVLGIAARPFLENFISGIVISMSHRLHIGDTIYIDGELGTVEDITITHTTVKIWNWQRYTLPNAVMLDKAVRNCTHDESLLWTHIEFTASYDQNVDELAAALTGAVAGSQHVAQQWSAELWPMELREASIRYWLAAWADGPDAAWYLRHDMRRAVIRTFQERGIASHLHHLAGPDQVLHSQPTPGAA